MHHAGLAGFGDAPVPTWLSMICKPDAVVMAFCGLADARVAIAAAAAAAANMVLMIVRRKIASSDTFCDDVRGSYPSAQPSCGGREPPAACPCPIDPDCQAAAERAAMLVVLWRVLQTLDDLGGTLSRADRRLS